MSKTFYYFGIVTSVLLTVTTYFWYRSIFGDGLMGGLGMVDYGQILLYLGLAYVAASAINSVFFFRSGFKAAGWVSAIIGIAGAVQIYLFNSVMNFTGIGMENLETVLIAIMVINAFCPLALGASLVLSDTRKRSILAFYGGILILDGVAKGYIGYTIFSTSDPFSTLSLIEITEQLRLVLPIFMVIVYILELRSPNTITSQEEILDEDF